MVIFRLIEFGMGRQLKAKRIILNIPYSIKYTLNGNYSALIRILETFLVKNKSALQRRRAVTTDVFQAV